MKKNRSNSAIVVNSCIFTLQSNIVGGADVPANFERVFSLAQSVTFLRLSTPVVCVNAYTPPAMVDDNGPGSAVFFLNRFRMSSTKQTAGSAALHIDGAILQLITRAKGTRKDGKKDLRFGCRQAVAMQQNAQAKRAATVAAKKAAQPAPAPAPKLTKADQAALAAVKQLLGHMSPAEAIKHICDLTASTVDYMAGGQHFGQEVNGPVISNLVCQSTTIISFLADVSGSE